MNVEEGYREGSHYYHIGDGYYYHFNYDNETTLYFRCTQYRSGCLGRALLRRGQQLEHSEDHNHPRNVAYSAILAARMNIVNRAREFNFVTFSDILEEERSRIEDRRVRRELTLRRLRPAMLRARSSIFPQLPRTLLELSNILEDPIWRGITQTVDDQDNMYCGSVTAPDGSHNIIFMSSRFLSLMREVSVIFADGTFYITPSVEGCYQVFTLVAVWSHTVVPLAWCLMERKTEMAYVAVLSFVRARLQSWRFTKVICDFEDAMINAFRSVFAVDVQGCLFHSVNAMVKYARSEIGLATLMEYEQLRDIVRFCCVLPLLPQHLIQRGLNIIGIMAMQLGPILYPIIRPFLTYVQNEWLNHANRGPCLSVWNSFHRTNNASESNNRRMRRKFGVHHPNVFYFIRKLCYFEDSAYDDVMSISTGITPSRHRSVSSVMNDNRIRNLTRIYLQNIVPTDEEIAGFLQAASYTVDNLFYEGLRVPQPM